MENNKIKTKTEEKEEIDKDIEDCGRRIERLETEMKELRETLALK